MPDVAQTPPKADGGEGKEPNAEAEKLAAQQKEDVQKAQAVQARMDAEDAEKTAQIQTEAINNAGQEKKVKLDETVEELKKNPTGPEAGINLGSSTPEQAPTVEGQVPVQPVKSQPNIGQNKMPETPTSEQMPTQEPVTQPVKAEVAEETKTTEKEPEAAKKKSNSIWNLFGLFGSKPKNKSNQEEDPHPNSVETINNSNNPEDIERIAVEDKPTEVGQDPENKQ